MSRYFSEMQKKSSAKRWAGTEAEDRSSAMKRMRVGISVKPPVKLVDPDTGRISYPRPPIDVSVFLKPSVEDSPSSGVSVASGPKDAPNPIVVLPVAVPASVVRPKRDFFAGLRPVEPKPKSPLSGANHSGKTLVPAYSEPFVE